MYYCIMKCHNIHGSYISWLLIQSMTAFFHFELFKLQSPMILDDGFLPLVFRKMFYYLLTFPSPWRTRLTSSILMFSFKLLSRCPLSKTPLSCLSAPLSYLERPLPLTYPHLALLSVLLFLAIGWLLLMFSDEIPLYIGTTERVLWGIHLP